MRAPDDAIDGYHRFGTMQVDESNDCFGNFWIGSRISGFAEPPLKRVGVSTFVRDDTNRDLRRTRVVGPVEGNRCHRVAAEAPVASFRELVSVPLSLECHDRFSHALPSDVSGATDLNQAYQLFTLLTGASSGIGHATAKVFAAEGAKVIAGARRESKLEELVAQIRSAGGEVAAMAGDVLSRKDTDRCG